MAKAQYSRLEELHVKIDGDVVKISYDPEFGPGSLDDCKYGQFKLSDSPGYVSGQKLGFHTWLEFPINDNAKLIVHPLHRSYGSWFGSAQFVVEVDKAALGKNIYACPVCTNQKGLKAFPLLRHDMAPDGRLSNPGNPEEHYGNNSECECSCGFIDRRLSFDTETWDEHEQ